MNNFYNEAAPARQVEALVRATGQVPPAVARKFTRTLVEVFLGNGYGISWAADPVYRRLLERIGPDEARRALRAFAAPAISSLLWTSVARSQWAQLLDILEPKLTRRSDRDLLGAVRAFTGTPDQLRSDSAIKKMLGPL